MSDDRRPFATPGDAERRDRRHASAAAKYGGLGFQFAASIILFLYAGRWLDRKLDSEPWFLILGVFTGAGAAFYSMYRTLMADQRREDEERLARKRDEGKAP
jgi:F0F1-type ATP synthase assembly protein I